MGERAGDGVGDRQRQLLGVELEAAPVLGSRSPLEAVVAAGEDRARTVGAPLERLGPGPVAERKARRGGEGVLLLAVDPQRRVGGGRAEQVPQLRVGEVAVGPRVLDQRLVAEGEAEGELVVVRVAALAAEAGVAAADQKMDTAAADDEVAAVGEADRAGFGRGLVGRPARRDGGASGCRPGRSRSAAGSGRRRCRRPAAPGRRAGCRRRRTRASSRAAPGTRPAAPRERRSRPPGFRRGRAR